jgi:hypothetical protein
MVSTIHTMTLGDRTVLVSSGLIRVQLADGTTRVVTLVTREDGGPYRLTLGGVVS